MHNEDGANIDNSATTLLFHVSHRRLGDEVRPFQIAMNVPVEIVFGVVEERFQSKDPGIIDQHIHTPESLNRHLDHFFTGCFVPDIPLH